MTVPNKPMSQDPIELGRQEADPVRTALLLDNEGRRLAYHQVTTKSHGAGELVHGAPASRALQGNASSTSDAALEPLLPSREQAAVRVCCASHDRDRPPGSPCPCAPVPRQLILTSQPSPETPHGKNPRPARPDCCPSRRQCQHASLPDVSARVLTK